VHRGRVPLFAFEGREPHVSPAAWVAPTATLVGDVRVEAKAPVWYGGRAAGRFRGDHRPGSERPEWVGPARGSDLSRIEAHPAELNRVWTNLMDNAIDATEGQGTIQISAQPAPVCHR
jgi:signal transduction histidine kinase